MQGRKRFMHKLHNASPLKSVSSRCLKFPGKGIMQARHEMTISKTGYVGTTLWGLSLLRKGPVAYICKRVIE